MANEMDEMDKRLLAALRHDARASLSDLSVLLGIGRATVRARLEKMQARGDIVGFSVVTRDDVAEDPVRGLMMIAIEGRGTDRLVRQLSGFVEVRNIWSTNGRWDVICDIRSDTLAAFDDVLSRIRKLEGIVGSETSLLLSTRKGA